ncbi:hypothetical protein ADUPG1_001793, partial [Aduncisulcus paluster]
DVIFNEDVDWSGDPTVHEVLVKALGPDYTFTNSGLGPNPESFMGEEKENLTYWGLYFVRDSHIEASTAGVGSFKIKGSAQENDIEEIVVPHLSFSSRIGDLDIRAEEDGTVDIDADAIVNTYNLDTNDYDYSVEVASKGAITIKNITTGSIEETGLTDNDGKYSTKLKEGTYD